MKCFNKRLPLVIAVIVAIATNGMVLIRSFYFSAITLDIVCGKVFHLEVEFTSK